jgi:hypothetical protein
LAYIEALVIMCAAYKGESIHNTQIDFLTRGSQPLIKEDIKSMISPQAFSDKLATTGIKRQQAAVTYGVHCEVQDQADKELLRVIFSNKRVRKRIADPISETAENLTSFIKLDRSVKQNKNKKQTKERKVRQAL